MRAPPTTPICKWDYPPRGGLWKLGSKKCKRIIVETRVFLSKLQSLSKAGFELACNTQATFHAKFGYSPVNKSFNLTQYCIRDKLMVPGELRPGILRQSASYEWNSVCLFLLYSSINYPGVKRAVENSYSDNDRLNEDNHKRNVCWCEVACLWGVNTCEN